MLDIPGVHPHEWRVSDAVKAALPAWARAKATMDSAGNVIVEAGPDKDPVAFVAHMDEVGFTLDRINPDGSVTLRRSSAARWRRHGKGEVALLYFDRGAERTPRRAAARRVRSRATPRAVKAPRSLTAWFGLDSAGLASRGVAAPAR